MSNVTNEVVAQYEYAYKLGKKAFLSDKWNKRDPYLPSLDDIVDEYDCTRVELGTIDVPADLIIGTKTSGRTVSFASNFMPLFKPNSEFASKWFQVCSYHLSDTGITEPPKVYEYLGKFYVEEGNKRVSVLKSYGAVLIQCDVIRLIPPMSDDKEIKLYYEFLDYYKLSRLYSIQFNKSGYYKKLQKLMEFDDDYKWERYDRIRIIGFYEKLCRMLKKKNINLYYPDCLVVMLEIYGYEYLYEMKDKELSNAIDESKMSLIYDKAHYNILCVSDEEDNSLWNGCHNNKLKEYDFIISAGDLKAEYLEYLVTVSNRPLYYVYGNHDDKYDIKPPLGCECIDDKVVVYKGIRILGLGGSYKYRQDGKYMYTEKQMRKRIRKLKPKIRKVGGIDIIVTHAPAKGYGDLNDYAHQGFECFVDLIKEYKPKYFFFGHVHSRYDANYVGSYRLDNTQIINVSGRRKIVY